MSLKQIIRQQRILANAIEAELELPGEPLIYSIKYSVGHRKQSVQFFRNAKWKSLLKCFFRSYMKTRTPVVLLVRFYVTPPSSITVPARDLKKETVPAFYAYEICDYLLSFIEMLHKVLINSYKQLVKIDAEKFYSANPRTVFKFMSWEHYVKLQNRNTVHAKSQRKRQNRQEGLVQSDGQGNDEKCEPCAVPAI